MPEIYRATAISTGDGRNGQSRTTDGMLDLKLATPREQGGPGGATNPEQLLAAGWAGCFHSSIKAVARGRGITLTDSAVTVGIGLNNQDGAFSLSAVIDARLPGIEAGTGQELLDLAHQRCPYSKATRGNIDVQLRLTQ